MLWAAISSVRVSASQLEGWMFDPRPLSGSPQRSMGKSVHRNRIRQKALFRLHFLLHPEVYRSQNDILDCQTSLEKFSSSVMYVRVYRRISNCFVVNKRSSLSTLHALQLCYRFHCNWVLQSSFLAGAWGQMVCCWCTESKRIQIQICRTWSFKLMKLVRFLKAKGKVEKDTWVQWWKRCLGAMVKSALASNEHTS